MLKLLALRAGALFLRPAAVLLEHQFTSGGNALVLVLPVAAIALVLSSIPVYLDYYRTNETASDRHEVGMRYSSALTTIVLLTVCALAPLLMVTPLGLTGPLAAATCFVFLIEKYSDEASRAFEFRKAYFRWFLVQALRSGWMVFPVAAYALFDASYNIAFLIFAALAAVAAAALFWKTTALRPRISRDGFSLLGHSSIYLVGNLLPALYQQGPRILVARLFPDQAHLYMVLAQLCQSISLLFNIRFQIPYRKLAARRPRMFERRLRPTIIRLLLVIAVVDAIYLISPLAPFFPQELDGLTLIAVLAPMVVSDALMFSLLSVYLGYIPWFSGRRRALESYLICLGSMTLMALVVTALYRADILQITNLVALCTLLGFSWVGILATRHFRRRNSS